MSPRPASAAIYARVSTDEQRERQTIDTQLTRPTRPATRRCTPDG
jgi:DNA invertase Pin-like site-specific DNA recombinase